jgi:hypothetical protein
MSHWTRTVAFIHAGSKKDFKPELEKQIFFKVTWKAET